MKLQHLLSVFLLSFLFVLNGYAQVNEKLSFTGDFRFRIEQDWLNRQTDGNFLDDRTRLRYRLRFGFNYAYNDKMEFGSRIRTSAPGNQQDPHLTLGAGFKDFDVIPIGFEKLYFRYSAKNWTFWIGKNTFPFYKQNELFWSDNVYPDGVFVGLKDTIKSVPIQLNVGHFISQSNGKAFDKDAYLQGIQLTSTLFRSRIYTGIYYFANMPNIPDGKGTYEIDYTIWASGFKLKPFKNTPLSLTLDYYYNLNDYAQNDSIDVTFSNQKEGYVIALIYGTLKKKSDWQLKCTYTHLQRYSAVDFFAQNDWIRWSYGKYNSPAGRLTNFHGIELMGGYVINRNFNLKMRYFVVEQLIPLGEFKESGNRIRLDLNIGF